MKINNSIFDPFRPERGGSVDPGNAAKTGDASKPAAPVKPAARGDSVQISDSARTLASRADTEARANFDPERVAELRRKVYQGAYNTLDVVDQVARRMLSRGDL